MICDQSDYAAFAKTVLVEAKRIQSQPVSPKLNILPRPKLIRSTVGKFDSVEGYMDWLYRNQHILKHYSLEYAIKSLLQPLDILDCDRVARTLSEDSTGSLFSSDSFDCLPYDSYDTRSRTSSEISVDTDRSSSWDH